MDTTTSYRSTPLYGLILAGGFSTRMGMDKSMIVYHDMPQYEYICGLLSEKVSGIFLSCRPGQVFRKPVVRITDTAGDIGPMAGILAAFQFNPFSAWLVIACDLPYAAEDAIRHLLSMRQPDRQATYFVDPERQLPEPLLAIYEPGIFPLVYQHFRKGQYSLNQVLRVADGNGVAVPDPLWISSVNTPSELDQFHARRKG